MLDFAMVFLVTQLSAAATVPAAADSFGTLTIFREQGSPLLVIREQSTPPLLSIRLSIPVEEPPDLSGAGRVLQLLVRDRLRGEVERFGGRIEFVRTPTHLVYLVNGPALAFGDMVSVLRYAVAPPRSVFQAQKAVWLTARRETLAVYETPDRLVRHRLEAALFPARTLEYGALVATELPGPADLEWFWRRWFRPESISVIVVGPIAPEAVRAAFRGWPEPPSAGPRPSRPLPAVPAPAPEAISARLAIGYSGGAADPAALALATALVDESIRTLRLPAATAELWWLDGETALAVLVTAPANPGSGTSTLRTDLQIAISDAAQASPEEIARQRRRLRHQLLMRARTPAGLAAILGEFLERTGDPTSANRFLRALTEIEDDEVRSVLRRLVYQSPRVIELMP